MSLKPEEERAARHLFGAWKPYNTTGNPATLIELEILRTHNASFTEAARG